jgi:hypothetical protein
MRVPLGYLMFDVDHENNGFVYNVRQQGWQLGLTWTFKAGEIKVTGDAAEAARLIDLFDRYRPERVIAIPPAVLEHAR